MGRNWGTPRMLSILSSVSFLALSPAVSARSWASDPFPFSSTRLRSRSIISGVRRIGANGDVHGNGNAGAVGVEEQAGFRRGVRDTDRKSTRLNSSHLGISYA